METYTVEYKCSNCKKEFNKEVKKGKRPEGKGGICLHCGVKDTWTSRNQFWAIKIIKEDKE